VPVHTAHDRASLDDLLDLLSGKKLVLIDTAGMAQRDERTAELLEMLSHRMIQRILVLNAATQGETVEDVMQGYGAARCRGAIVSKIDEAAKIAPTLDALIRHKLRVLGVANGQRVPEDFHRVSSATLIERALRVAPSPAWRVEPSEINLVFAAQQRAAANPLRA
jgi:flagellar biosynthesis protein FlhF